MLGYFEPWPDYMGSHWCTECKESNHVAFHCPSWQQQQLCSLNALKVLPSNMFLTSHSSPPPAAAGIGEMEKRARQIKVIVFQGLGFASMDLDDFDTFCYTWCVQRDHHLLPAFWFFQLTRQSSIAASWPSVPCPSWSWLWLALPTRRPCLQRNLCSPWVSTKRSRHGTTSCTANVASHVRSKWDLGTSSTLVNRVHARSALTPMRLQTYEEVTSPTRRWTPISMKQRPMSKRAQKAFGVLCQEVRIPGTVHMFQVPTSSIAPRQEVLGICVLEYL